jgi:hypothetical protein
VRATLDAGENEAVLAYLAAHAAELEPSVINEARLIALFGLDRKAEALTLIEAWRASDGDTPQVLRLAARTYRENDELAKMDAALVSLRSLLPADPRTRVFAIIQTLLAGREDQGRAMIDDFIFRFGGTATNFAILATSLGEIGRLVELDTVLAAAAERGFRGSDFGLVRLKALIAAHRWPEASAQVASVRAGPLKGDAQSLALALNYYEAMLVALQDPARGAQSSFVDRVRPMQLSLQLYRQAIELLQKEGRVETARAIVTFAEGVFPGNLYFEKKRSELDAQLVALTQAARPEQATAKATLETPTAFFAALEDFETQNTPAAGLALIRDLRRMRPDWLAAHEEKLMRFELTFLAKGDDLVALQSTARSYLNGDITRANRVMLLASELHDEGQREKTRLLLDEVLRRTPGQERASRLRDTFFPPLEAAP